MNELEQYEKESKKSHFLNKLNKYSLNIGSFIFFAYLSIAFHYSFSFIENFIIIPTFLTITGLHIYTFLYFRNTKTFFNIDYHDNDEVTVNFSTYFNSRYHCKEVRHFKNGLLHNEQGKAIDADYNEYPEDECYYFEGKMIKSKTFEDFEKQVKILKKTQSF